MASIAALARFAALLGNPARAAMLMALRDGRALTATELARVAGIAPQTGSGHIALLSSGGLLTVKRQGRIRYHRLTSLELALVIDGLTRIAAALPGKRRKSAALRSRLPVHQVARTPFDYLAGLLGAAVLESIKRVGYMELCSGAAPLTQLGIQFLTALGVVAPVGTQTQSQSRSSLRAPFFDWRKGHRHLARAFGAAVFRHCLEHGWLTRIDGTRAFQVTPRGLAILRERFAVELDEAAERRT